MCWWLMSFDNCSIVASFRGRLQRSLQENADGFVKTVFDAQSGELLGAHMIGPEVTEQMQGSGLAQSLEATDSDLAPRSGVRGVG